MKKVMLFLSIFTVYSCRPNSDITISSSGPNAAIVHGSANDFAGAVGRYLKGNYPSRVTSVTAKLFIDNDQLSGVKNYRIKWHAKIEPTDSAHADYFFDRRGTLLSGQSEASATSTVDMEMELSSKVQIMIDEFEKVYGNHRMPETFVSQSTLQDGQKEWWCLKEYFCTANIIK